MSEKIDLRQTGNCKEICGTGRIFLQVGGNANKSKKIDLRQDQIDLRHENVDLRQDKIDLRHEKVDLRQEKIDLRQRGNGRLSCISRQNLEEMGRNGMKFMHVGRKWRKFLHVGRKCEEM